MKSCFKINLFKNLLIEKSNGKKPSTTPNNINLMLILFKKLSLNNKTY